MVCAVASGVVCLAWSVYLENREIKSIPGTIIDSEIVTLAGLEYPGAGVGLVGKFPNGNCGFRLTGFILGSQELNKRAICHSSVFVGLMILLRL